MDRGTWQASVHEVAKSQTRLSNFTFTFHFRASEKEMATHFSVFTWRIPGTGEPVGLPSIGSHRVGHHWSDLAAAAAMNVSLVALIFLKRSLVFSFYCFPRFLRKGHWGRHLISLWSSLELCIQMDISSLFSFTFCFSSFSTICNASSDKYFAFLHFSFLGMILITASYTMSWTSNHCYSGTFQIWSHESISHFHSTVIRDLI